MTRVTTGAIAALALAASSITLQGSSHREALAVLNEPCADNTDTYAWVSHGTHDKLYLIMNFNPLHEPGQGNQGLRACNGYRYEFHIGKGTSLKDQVVYRVEFTNTLTPEAAPSADRSARRRQRAALAAHRRHRDDDGDADRRRRRPRRRTATTRRSRSCSAATCRSCRTTTARRPTGSSTASGRSRATTPAIPTSREVGLYDQTFVDSYIHTLPNGGRIIAGQFDDPYQLDEKGIFDLVNLNRNDLGGIPGARRPPGEDVFTGFNVFSIALEVPITRHLPERHPAQRRAAAELDRQPAARLVEHQPPARRRPSIRTTSSPACTGSGNYVQVGRNALPLFNAGLVGTQRQTQLPAHQPDAAT